MLDIETLIFYSKSMNKEVVNKTEVQTAAKKAIIAPETWAEIKKGYIEDGLSQKKLSEMYGVAIKAVEKMITRRGWVKEREIYRIRRGANLEEAAKEGTDEGVGRLIKAGKDGCIDSMIEIAHGLLKKLEVRVRTLAASDDKEINRTTESMVRLYNILEPLLGIGKGDGNKEKVKANQVQAEILESAMDAVDLLKTQRVK